MASKRAKELRELSIEELDKQVLDLKNNIMTARFKAKVEKPTNVMEIRKAKKQIARIYTIIGEKKSAESKV